MSAQKVLLHLGTQEDADYQHRLAGISAGLQVAWKSRLSTPGTLAELEMQCKAAGVQGVVCSNPVFLDMLLSAQIDFVHPVGKNGRKKELTLDDYQGSLIYTPRENLPVVFINPLANLVTVPHASPAAKRFIKKVAKPSDWYPQTEFKWQVGTEQNLAEIFARFQTATLISVDIETPIPNPLRTINCVGYCAYFRETHTTECVVIPFTGMFELTWIRKFNRLPSPKVTQGGSYDNVYLLRFNAPLYNWIGDTYHLFHSWYSEYPKRLDFVTAYLLRDVRFWKDDGKTGNIVDYYRYNAKDCWATANSWLAALGECDDYALDNYLEEFPLVFPCIHCELEGLACDKEQFAIEQKKLENEVQQEERSFQTMTNAPGFNVGSWQQMQKLFTVLGVGHIAKTDGTGKIALLKAQAAHPLANKVLTAAEELKKDRKLLGTYYNQEKLWNGRIFYRLDPAGTDTGRLASSESSYWCGWQIQNFPREGFKQVVVSDPGWLLCEIDKAQAEARCVGYLSGEEKLIQLVESDKDYHSWNASAFFGVKYEDVWDQDKKKPKDKVLRDLSKRTNHGANYNMGPGVMLNTMGPKKVSQAKVMLKLTGSLRQVCEFLLAQYERTYPRVKGLYYDFIIERVSKTGRLVSALGWTRTFFSRPGRLANQKPALNAAVAHEPQNLSVAIINRELYNVWHAQIYGNYFKLPRQLMRLKDYLVEVCEKTEYDLRGLVRIKAQIHDSIFFQYKGEDTPEKVAVLMRTPLSIVGADKVTRTMIIPVDISAGRARWSELK